MLSEEGGYVKVASYMKWIVEANLAHSYMAHSQLQQLKNKNRPSMTSVIATVFKPTTPAAPLSPTRSVMFSPEVAGS